MFLEKEYYPMENPYLAPLVCSPARTLAESALEVSMSLEKGGELPLCYPHLLSRFWILHQGDEASRSSIVHSEMRSHVLRELARQAGIALPTTCPIAYFFEAAAAWFQPLYSNLEEVCRGKGDRELAKKLLLHFNEVCLTEMWRKSERHYLVA